MRKSVALLSGGMDSLVATWHEMEASQIDLLLTFDYGQKSAVKEVLHARTIAQYLNVPHQTIALPWLQEITRTALVADSCTVPLLSLSELDHRESTVKSAKAVWVPNRNGVFINIAAALAEACGASDVIIGFNAEEAQTFPDNSVEFAQAQEQALSYATATAVKVCAPTARLDKTAIVALGLRLGVDWDLMWSCYLAGPKMCGECESCLRSLRAFAHNDFLAGVRHLYQTIPHDLKLRGVA